MVRFRGREREGTIVRKPRAREGKILTCVNRKRIIREETKKKKKIPKTETRQNIQI